MNENGKKKWGQLYFPIAASAKFGKRKRNNPKINNIIKFLGFIILLYQIRKSRQLWKT